MREQTVVMYLEKINKPSELSLEENSDFIFGRSSEERSSAVADCHVGRVDIHAWEIIADSSSSATISLNGDVVVLQLRSESQLRNFWLPRPRTCLYLDITGLPHHVWAPLLRSALVSYKNVYVLYVEPESYTRSETPMDGQIYDLSERISGLAPLPGFATIRVEQGKDEIFVPLLGFEGTRLAFLVEQVQPNNEKIIPIVGVPGFRAEYPFEAFLGNKRVLVETSAWRQIEFASADCPFSIFYLLERIAGRNRDLLTIAPDWYETSCARSNTFQNCLSSDHRDCLRPSSPQGEADKRGGTDTRLLRFVSNQFSTSLNRGY